MKDFEKIFYEFKTENKEGFTDIEQLQLLENFPDIDKAKYYSTFAGTTAITINNQMITFPDDVLLALRLCMKNREIKSWEFD